MRSCLALAVLATSWTAAATAATSDVNTYPLRHCIVSGETLGSDAVSRHADGREIRFCDESCAGEFDANAAPVLQKLDRAIIESQLDVYPLETCVVSGKTLGGEMGEPVDHLVGNRLVRLCCEMCMKDLEADPDRFVQALDDAATAAQVGAYPARTCPISGAELGSMGDPFDFVYAGTLVRFCCGGCVGAFNEDPTTAMSKVYGEVDATSEPEHDHSDHDHSNH